MNLEDGKKYPMLFQVTSLGRAGAVLQGKRVRGYSWKMLEVCPCHLNVCLCQITGYFFISSFEHFGSICDMLIIESTELINEYWEWAEQGWRPMTASFEDTKRPRQVSDNYTNFPESPSSPRRGGLCQRLSLLHARSCEHSKQVANKSKEMQRAYAGVAAPMFTEISSSQPRVTTTVPLAATRSKGSSWDADCNPHNPQIWAQEYNNMKPFKMIQTLLVFASVAISIVPTRVGQKPVQ